MDNGFYCQKRSRGVITDVLFVLVLLLFLLCQACAGIPCRDVHNAQEEKDNIYTLLAYSVVLKDWQNSDMEHNRGYNIGSVLVENESGKVVYWARNSVNVTRNMSQHGEVRLMNCYLANNKVRKLDRYTVYTTLEPCAMCSGMMMLTSVPRTVYGQSDPSYGKAIERLELDSAYGPYPRHVESSPSISRERCRLDALYDKYRNVNKDAHITIFLTTDEAKKVYDDAYNDLLSFRVAFPENQPALDQAREYLKNVPEKYQADCPPQ